MGKKPDKEFKGSFNVILKHHLHRLAVIKSTRMKIPLVERARTVERSIL